MALCGHCQSRVPKRGYCCERRELETLRVVADEVTRLLGAEIASARTIGALDAVETMELSRDKLQKVRVV